MEEYKRIIYQPGKVTRIIINRPRWQNAISHPTYAEIEDGFKRAAADKECRVLVVSGAGNNFSSGHDTIGGSPEGAPVLADGVPAEELRKRFKSEKEMWKAYWEQHNWYAWQMHPEVLWSFPKPSIAMVHGYAIYGGVALAEMCDLIFATEDAMLLHAGANGPDLSHLSPRIALEIAYEHRFMTGAEAKECGIVNRIYPDFDTLERETLAFAERVAENPLAPLMHVKAGVHARIEHQGYPKLWWDGLKQSAWEMLSGTATAGRASIEGPNPEEANRQRYEGKGMARTPRAFANLKTKLEGEGKPVPQKVIDALARAAAQDPKAFWDRALHQGWRDPESVKRAEEQAKIYADYEERERQKKAAEEATVPDRKA